MLECTQISEALIREFIQSLSSLQSYSEVSDLEITFSELDVWFSNRDSDKSLDKVKEVFDSLEQNRLGKASLRSFMQSYVKELDNISQSLLKIQQETGIINNLISTISQLEATNNEIIHQKKGCIKMSFQKIMEIDLTPSFQKRGFEGYQLIAMLDDKQMYSSEVTELEGISISFQKLNGFTFKLKPKSKTLQLQLLEVLTTGIKTIVATANIDPFAFAINNSIAAPRFIPMTATQQSNKIQEIYCQLIFSASLQEITETKDCHNRENSLLQVRQNYLLQKQTKISQKYSKIQRQLKHLTKPFSSIKIHEMYCDPLPILS